MSNFFFMIRNCLPNRWPWLGLPLSGFVVGKYFDSLETERLTLFRDKTALYGRPLKEGEAPTWP